jgi:hypothetical protein
MMKCPSCHRNLKDGSQKYCSECSRGLGQKAVGTPGSTGVTAAKRRRRRGR